MLSDWETETDLVAAITTTQLTNWIAELKAANEAFNDRYIARVYEESATPGLSFTGIREEGVNSYKVLVAHIEAHATLGSNATHQELVNQIGTLAKQYNQTVSLRLRSDATDAEDTAPIDSTDDSVSNAETE